MDDRLTARINLFAENTRALSPEFRLTNPLTKRMVAFMFALEDKPVDPGALREAKALIDSSTGIFSALRGNMELALAAQLCLSDDPERLLQGMLGAYKRLTDARFARSDHLVMAAHQLATEVSEAEQPHAIERARAFYDGLRGKHFFLTGQDDYIFCVMLGLSRIPLSEGLDRIERLYEALRPELGRTSAAQGLAQVLVLGDAPGDAAGRVLQLRRALREQGLRSSGQFTQVSLGALALLPGDVRAIGCDLQEAVELLKALKVGRFSATKQELLLLAAAAQVSVQIEDARRGVLPSLATGLTGLLIAQEAAMAAIVASSAAAASSSSSSG